VRSVIIRPHAAVGCGRRRHRYSKLACGLARELDVLVHEADVEPRLFRQVEDEVGSCLQHRRADRAPGHHVDRELAVDA